jgi:hypothetical protein
MYEMDLGTAHFGNSEILSDVPENPEIPGEMRSGAYDERGRLKKALSWYKYVFKIFSFIFFPF